MRQAVLKDTEENSIESFKVYRHKSIRDKQNIKKKKKCM